MAVSGLDTVARSAARSVSNRIRVMQVFKSLNIIDLHDLSFVIGVWYFAINCINFACTVHSLLILFFFPLITLPYIVY